MTPFTIRDATTQFIWGTGPHAGNLTTENTRAGRRSCRCRFRNGSRRAGAAWTDDSRGADAGRGTDAASRAGRPWGRGAQPAPPPYEFPPDFTLEPRPEPPPGTADPGVMFTTIMDRPEVRILRVEIQPGAVRRVHTHEDVTFHLLMPLTGPLQVTAGPATVMARVATRPTAGRTAPEAEAVLAMALAAAREASH